MPHIDSRMALNLILIIPCVITNTPIVLRSSNNIWLPAKFNLHLPQSVMPTGSPMVLVLKELLNQTAVSVTQLEMQLMPFTRTKMMSAYVSILQ